MKKFLNVLSIMLVFCMISSFTNSVKAQEISVRVMLNLSLNSDTTLWVDGKKAQIISHDKEWQVTIKMEKKNTNSMFIAKRGNDTIGYRLQMPRNGDRVLLIWRKSVIPTPKMVEVNDKSKKIHINYGECRFKFVEPGYTYMNYNLGLYNNKEELFPAVSDYVLNGSSLDVLVPEDQEYGTLKIKSFNDPRTFLINLQKDTVYLDVNYYEILPRLPKGVGVSQKKIKAPKMKKILTILSQREWLKTFGSNYNYQVEVKKNENSYFTFSMSDGVAYTQKVKKDGENWIIDKIFFVYFSKDGNWYVDKEEDLSTITEILECLQE